ncbi:sensor histidine kinase [Kribbella lupini]|uniref:histidine kinase n=1 Tax=Kribbella lupini TaxID=291602 RepID=A0ABP4LB90_9ACTN
MDAIEAAPPPPLSRWQSTWRYGFAISVGAGFWIASYFNLYDGRLNALWIVDLLLGALGVFLLRLRRRHPLAIALIINLFGAFSTSVSGAVVVTTLSLATRRRWREIVPVAAVGFLASVVFFETHPGSDDSVVSSFLFTLVFVSGVIAPGMYVGARRDLLAGLRERADRAEREQGFRVAQAQLTERARIAREMHDVLAHRLSLVALHAGALEYCRRLSDDEVAEAAAVTRQSAHLALEELHDILGVLRTLQPAGSPERPQPTLVDLPALVEETSRSGTKIRLHNRIGNLSSAPDALGRSAYRMIQESLTNARKHAPDTAVDVTLDGRPGELLVLEVRNPLRLGAAVPAGAGQPPPDSRPSALQAPPGAGLGLLGLAERAELVGGRFEHATADGQFVVRAWLPWPA